MTLLGVLGTFEILLILFIVAFLVVLVLFILTQYNTLEAIQPQNRFMSPGEVWLQLIPLFGLVWQFIVVTRIANSIQKELSSDTMFSFENQNTSYSQYSGDKPTYNIGIAFCILSCCGIIPVLGWVATLAGFVCRIVYWVQIAEYKNKIQRKKYSDNYSQAPPTY